MDLLPILFDAQLFVIVVVLICIVFEDKLKAFEQRVFRRFKRRKEGVRCMDGKIVGAKPIPVMTAEEIIKVCDSL